MGGFSCRICIFALNFLLPLSILLPKFCQARPHLLHALETGDLSELVDPRLGKQYVQSEMFRMVEAAAACVRHSAPKRPRMVQVILITITCFNFPLFNQTQIAWNYLILGPSSLGSHFHIWKIL